MVNLNGVKSVNEMDVNGKCTMEKEKAIAAVINSTHNPVVLIDAGGQRVNEFRTNIDMVRAVVECYLSLLDT